MSKKDIREEMAQVYRDIRKEIMLHTHDKQSSDMRDYIHKLFTTYHNQEITLEDNLTWIFFAREKVQYERAKDKQNKPEAEKFLIQSGDKKHYDRVGKLLSSREGDDDNKITLPKKGDTFKDEILALMAFYKRAAFKKNTLAYSQFDTENFQCYIEELAGRFDELNTPPARVNAEHIYEGLIKLKEQLEVTISEVEKVISKK